MKLISRIILILAFAFIGYGYWGAFTNSGNKVYDEMDGIFPFFIMIVGVVLFVVFLIMMFIMRRKAKR